MQILPVIDLLQGVVVRGIAGRRESYRPIISQLTQSAEPLAVAQAIREQFGCRQFYVADLDAIQWARPNYDLYRQFTAAGFDLLIDAGVQTAADAEAAFQAGAAAVIVGLESISSPDCLSDLVAASHPDRLLFSIDLINNRPLTHSAGWARLTALRIGEIACQAGFKRLIILDLASVGVHGGLSTLPLCTRIRGLYPEIELITGGGVRGVDDLKSLQNAGVDGVLIASALHDGRLTRAELEALKLISPNHSLPLS